MWSKVVLSFAVLCAFGVIVQAQYEDVRCKCVCPSVQQPNSTESHPLIMVHTFSEPSRCKCQNVVDQSLWKNNGNFCDQCQCKWQRRNTTTIKVVVILIICVVALLFLYMLFLLCLDPLMSRRPKTYLEQHNEEVNLDTQSVTQMVSDDVAAGARPRPGVISRVRQEVSKVRGEQQKWKGQVQEQRRNIYDRHTIAN